ncbi:MAG: cell wall hydrolase [Eubacteriales bacterium]|nr:cell wall hydrolase [Eubacteriales bacterium]
MEEVLETLLGTTYKRTRRFTRRLYRRHSTAILTACMLTIAFLCAIGVSGGSRKLVRIGKSTVSAAGGGINEVQAAKTVQAEELHAGLKGVVHGAITMEEYLKAAKEIDMAGANEEILVGAAKVSRQEAMRSTIEQGTKSAADIVPTATQLVRDNQMPESEYYTLLRIVEAEATGEDLKGKMLIANVILNRVSDERFPNTIEEVVWQEIGGAAQFQPTIDGRINSVEITEETIEAVDRVLAGEDDSRGALYFMARAASDDASVGWFDETLIPLFSYGGHEYYTLSEDARVS